MRPVRKLGGGHGSGEDLAPSLQVSHFIESLSKNSLLCSGASDVRSTVTQYLLFIESLFESSLLYSGAFNV